MDKKKNKKSVKKPENIPDNMPDNMPAAPSDNRPNNKIRTAAVLLAVVIIGCALVFGTHLLNLSPTVPVQGTGSGNLTVYYFYGAECPHCHNVTPYVESLAQKYPDVNFRILEIWHDDNNNALSRLLNHNLNQTQYGVPEAIVGDVVLLGEYDIPAKLEGAILAQKKKPD